MILHNNNYTTLVLGNLKQNYLNISELINYEFISRKMITEIALITLGGRCSLMGQITVIIVMTSVRDMNLL